MLARKSWRIRRSHCNQLQFMEKRGTRCCLHRKISFSGPKKASQDSLNAGRSQYAVPNSFLPTAKEQHGCLDSSTLAPSAGERCCFFSLRCTCLPPRSGCFFSACGRGGVVTLRTRHTPPYAHELPSIFFFFFLRSSTAFAGCFPCSAGRITSIYPRRLGSLWRAGKLCSVQRACFCLGQGKRMHFTCQERRPTLSAKGRRCVFSLSIAHVKLAWDAKPDWLVNMYCLRTSSWATLG